MRPLVLLGLLAAKLSGQSVSYANDVHPVLAAKCFACHGDDKRSGGLSLRDYASILEGGRSGAVVVPGEAAESLLLRRTNGEVLPVMPPAGPRLTAGELDTLARWINQGVRQTPESAAAKRRWSPPLALAKPAVPPVRWAQWERPLDRLVADYLARQGVSSAPPLAPDRVVARRQYLDLWGFMPSLEQANEFLQDRGPDKRSRLARQLLSHSRNYAGHWLTFWNDLLRNEDSFGVYGGDRKTITPWLERALEENLPYDRFVRALLDPRTPQDPEGFLIGVNWRGEANASQTPWMQAAQNSAQVFLGINLKCNSCHDSFISRWKLQDAYNLASFFAPEPNLELVRCDAATGRYARGDFLYPELNRPVGSTLAERRTAVANLFLDPRNGRTPRTLVNRVWQRLMGRGLVEPVDEMDNEPWDPAILDWLAAEFVEHGYDLKWLIETIVTSNAYQLPSAAPAAGEVQAAGGYVFRGPEVRRLTAEQFIDSISSLTGEWPVFQPPSAREARYVREAHMLSTPLSRALGRPIRDQVITERASASTTLQALELVNGRDLYALLRRGARRLMGEEPPAPKALADTGRLQGIVKDFQPVPVEADLRGQRELWLLVRDLGSYDPVRTRIQWLDARLHGPGGETVSLDSLTPLRQENAGGSRSTLVYDLRGGNWVRFTARATIEPASRVSDIMPMVRFFVFGERPNEERLIPLRPETPVPSPPQLARSAVASRLWTQALGRPPLPAEAALFREVTDTDSLTDFLWSLTMLPEFQLIP